MYMSGRSGPTVSDHTPSAPFSKGTGAFLPSATRMATPASDTARASGAFSRNVTVRSSRTSGELSGALKGTRFSVFFCGLWSRLTFACCARAVPHTMLASSAKSADFICVVRLLPSLRRVRLIGSSARECMRLH